MHVNVLFPIVIHCFSRNKTEQLKMSWEFGILILFLLKYKRFFILDKIKICKRYIIIKHINMSIQNKKKNIYNESQCKSFCTWVSSPNFGNFTLGPLFYSLFMHWSFSSSSHYSKYFKRIIVILNTQLFFII